MSGIHNSVGLESTNPSINDSIVASTINYYGHGLLKQLADFKPDLIPNSAVTRINYHSFQARASRLGEHEEVKFYTTAVDFILSNAEHFFSQFSPRDIALADRSKYGYIDKYKILPPIEYYLQANKRVRMLQFNKDVCRGDILICRAIQMQAVGRTPHQSLKVVARDSGPHMLLVKGLTIMVSLDLSKTRIPKIDESSVPNTWLTNTLLRVEVLAVTGPEDEPVISVGTMGDTLIETGRLEVSLGKVARTDVPDIINSVESYTRDSVGSFDTCLRRLEGFKNPRCVQHIAKQMALSMTNSSLMRTLRDGFPPTLQFRQLRRQQLARWAHKHVADGVAHFKRGEHTEAFQLLNKALSIDAENVEAFVAKGALLANMGSFEKAVEDFECALKHNPEHGNARKYICETLLELGKRHEEEGAMGAAEHCYLRSLKVNPEHKGCFHALTKLHGRSGFKSSLTKELLEEMSPEAEVKAELVMNKANDVKEDEMLQIEEKFPVDAESEPALAQPRERSLSPLSQKMAMQNNEWEPPSYLQTTSSYIHQQKGSPPPPPQLPTSANRAAAVEDKKGPIITPFVIGHSKNAFGDIAFEQTLTISESVELAHSSTSSSQSNISSAASAVLEAIAARENSPIVDDPTSANASPLPSTPISGTQPTVAGGKSELDISFENTMCIRPQTQDDSEALSMSLIVLSKRYKNQNNLVRARLCLEKSWKHNPKHGPTIQALHELTSSPQTPVDTTSTIAPARHISPVYYTTQYDDRATTLMSAYSQGGGFPVAYSAYIPPPPVLYPPQPSHDPYMGVEGGVGGYNNPPPAGGLVYQNPYAPNIAMSVPPPSTMMTARPTTPELGKWGAACPPTEHAAIDGVQNAGSLLSYSSREDKEYHDRVDSFLNKLMKRSQPTASSSKPRAGDYSPDHSGKRRSDRSRSRDDHALGARGRKRSREPLLAVPRNPPPLSDSRVLSPGSSESLKGSRKRHSKSLEKASKAKSKEPSIVRRDGSERSRKRSKENKKKRKHSVSSSSSSSSRSRSSSSTYSSNTSSSYSSSSSGGSRRKKYKSSKMNKRKQRRVSKRSRKNKGSKETKENKINLEDAPLLQGLDKEILKKITEKIQQSNALALETKLPKKKKKDKEASKKKEEGKALKKEGEKIKEKNKSKKKEVEQKIEDCVEESSSSSRGKKNKKAIANELADTKKKENDEVKRTSLVAKMKKEAALRVANVVKESTDSPREFRALDLEKAAQKDTSLNIKALMELPGLEDLQKKLLNYYSKCDVKITEDSPSGNGRPKLPLEEASSKSPMNKERNSSSKTVPKKPSFKNQTTDEPSQDKKSKAASTSSGQEPKTSEKEASSKTDVTSGKSPPKDPSKDKIKINTSPPEEYGPPAPPNSGFKSTFFPIFDTPLSMFFTPKEFREGAKEAKIKEFKDMVTKAQNAANRINMKHSAGPKQRRRKSSTSPSPGRHSRSTSRSRRSRSSSRGRRSRSRSRDRRSRSRSRGRRSRSRDRRSKSRSRDRRSRSRSRGRRSLSRGRGRHSRSPSFRSRSRSPRFRYRESNLPHRGRGFRDIRYNNRGIEKRSAAGNDRRRQSRSRSRSYSPRRPPPKRDSGAKRSSGKEKTFTETERDKTSLKGEMLGKLEKTGAIGNHRQK